MTANGPRHQDRVAGPHVGRTEISASGDHADPGSIDVDRVPLPTIDHLGVSGDDLNLCMAGRFGERIEDAGQTFEWESLLQDERAREADGAGTAHSQIIDRAVNRELANISTGKLDRVHHEGVGREGQTLVAQSENGAIVTLGERLILKPWPDNFLKELSARSGAGPVRERDPIGLDGGGTDGAGQPLRIEGSTHGPAPTDWIDEVSTGR